jgi:UV DNA damage endonuclease
MQAPLRLGFAVKVLGQRGLKSNDSRRWQKGPHLRTSTEYLHAIFQYLKKRELTMYRISSDIAPYSTHPGMPQFHRQVEEAADDLRALGAVASAQGLRLSFHPSQYIVLNSANEKLTAQSIRDIELQAQMLELLGQGPEGVIVIHVGGVYGEREAARDRWARSWEKLSAVARRRLVLENDDVSFSCADVLALHRQTGVKLVFDHQHFWCLNPDALPLRATVEKFLRTWPKGVRPKIHYSSPRTELREIKRKDRKTGKSQLVLQPPLLTGHADYTNPIEFIMAMRELEGLEFDIMLEAKAKDLAVLRLRKDLARLAPELARKYGIEPAEAAASEEEELVSPEEEAV